MTKIPAIKEMFEDGSDKIGRDIFRVECVPAWA